MLILTSCEFTSMSFCLFFFNAKKILLFYYFYYTSPFYYKKPLNMETIKYIIAQISNYPYVLRVKCTY